MKRLFSGQSISDFISVSMKRQILAVFVLLSMVINGFIPQSIGNKDSLFVVMAGVAGNTIIGMFNECCDTLTDVSNKLTKDLYKFLMLGEVTAGAQEKEEGNKKPIEEANTSSDMGLMVERDGYEEMLGERDENIIPIFGEGKAEDKLYLLYNRLKVYCSNEKLPVVLFFIVFIISIRNRKGWIDSIKNNTVKCNRTDLCI